LTARKHGYVATYHLQMLEQLGGRKTAIWLLAKQGIQQGLMKFTEIGLLEESLEAIVLKEKYRSLFRDDEKVYLDNARRRLEALRDFKT
jgi:hypothetical protein